MDTFDRSCKFFVSGRCQHYVQFPFCSGYRPECPYYEPAMQSGMNHDMVERLLGAVFCALFAVVCVAQAFKAAFPHHRVLFVIGAVVFAFASGHELARKSTNE